MRTLKMIIGWGCFGYTVADFVKRAGGDYLDALFILIPIIILNAMIERM